jgi:transketolase
LQINGRAPTHPETPSHRFLATLREQDCLARLYSRDVVLPPSVRARVSVEAPSPFGWERYVGPAGAIIGVNRFGASAPGPVVMREFGFTPAQIVETAKAVLKQTAASS